MAEMADLEQPEDHVPLRDTPGKINKVSWFGGRKKSSDSSSSRILASRYGLNVLGGGFVVRSINMLLLMSTTLWFGLWVTLAFSDLEKITPWLSDKLYELGAPNGPLGVPVSRNESDLEGPQGFLLGCERADVTNAVKQPINAFVGGVFFLVGMFCLMLSLRDFAIGTKRSAANARSRQNTVVSRQNGGLTSFVQDGPTGQDILPNYNIPASPASLLVSHSLWSLLFAINFVLLGASSFVFHSTNAEDALQANAASWWFILVSVFTYSVARFLSLSASNGGPESCCVLDDRCGCTCAVECSPNAGRLGMLTITIAGVAGVIISDVVIWHNIDVMVGLTESAQITLGIFLGVGIVSTFFTSYTMSHEIKSAWRVGLAAVVLAAVAGILLWMDTQSSICDPESGLQLHALANVFAAMSILSCYVFFRGDLRVGYVERTIDQRQKIQSLLSSRASIASNRSSRMMASPLGGGDSMEMVRSPRSAGSRSSDGRDHYVINRVNTTTSMSSDRSAGRSRRGSGGSVRSNASGASRGSRRSQSSRSSSNTRRNESRRGGAGASVPRDSSVGRSSQRDRSDDSSGSTGSPRRGGGEARHHISSSKSSGSSGSGSRRQAGSSRSRTPAASQRSREPEPLVEADVSDSLSVASGGSRGSRSSDNSRLSAGRVRLSAMAPIQEADVEEHPIASASSAADGANRLSGDPQVRLARLRERQRALREERAKGMAKNKNNRRNKGSSASSLSRSSTGSASSGGMNAQPAGGARSRGSGGSGSSGGRRGRSRAPSENSRVVAHWTCSRCTHADNELQDAECNVCRHRRPPLSDMMRVTQPVAQV
jgi:hypothetical protein